MIPNKLKDDAIIETTCEVKFETDISPEIVLGRLSDEARWSDYERITLQTMDIPLSVRERESGLRYQPVLEFRNEQGTQAVKIGPKIMIMHLIREYIGWAEYSKLINEFIHHLFSKIKDVNTKRLGFRYVNALTSDRHNISGVSDLNLNFNVAGESLEEQANLIYQTTPTDTHTVMTKIGSSSFAQGKLPANTTAIVDIDVFTPHDFHLSDGESVLNWMHEAHDYEKEAFFKLFTEEQISQLKED